MQKLRSVQVLRGVAALGVVVHHFCDHSDPAGPARLGAAGVDLFFVISGFIMATVMADRSATQFLTDRVRRIYPLWFIAAAPWLLLFHKNSGSILTTLTLWPVWGRFYFPALTLGWTLCFEMLFYVAFAVGLATRAWVAPVLFGITILLGLLFPSVPALAFIGSPMCLEFLAGVAIASVAKHEGLGAGLILIGFALFLTSPMWSSIGDFDRITGPAIWLRLPTWGIPAAFVVYGFVSLERRFEARSFRLPLLLGDASYAIYLFHKLFLGLPLNWVLSAMFAVAFCVGIHLMVERPMLRAMRQFKAPRTSLSAALRTM